MNPPEFTTDDYGLANWLVFNGVELAGTAEYKDNPKKRFVFINRHDIPELTAEWVTPTIDETVICQAFFKAHRIIKHSLKESLRVG